MKKSFVILHLCAVIIGMMLCSCSSKEEVQKPKNEGIILLQDTENDPDPVIRHENQSSVKTDAAPNLMWSQPSPGPMYYDTIAEYCYELREGGFSDWRAPTTEELKSIMKECFGFKEGSGIFYTEKESETLRTDVNGFFLYDGCFWSFNEKENDQNWFNGYGMVSGKSCLADPDWHPCRPCKRDLCHVACVREQSGTSCTPPQKNFAMKVGFAKKRKTVRFPADTCTTTAWTTFSGCMMPIHTANLHAAETD